MLNQAVLVGRIADDITDTTLLLKVPRCFKNDDGVYEDDMIEVELPEGIAKNAHEYCKKGDLVGVKGRIARLNNKEGMKLIADKLTFLEQRKKGKKNND